MCGVELSAERLRYGRPQKVKRVSRQGRSLAPALCGRERVKLKRVADGKLSCNSTIVLCIWPTTRESKKKMEEVPLSRHMEEGKEQVTIKWHLDVALVLWFCC